MSEQQFIDPEFASLISTTVIETLDVARNLQETNKYISTHSDYPTMSFRDKNGLPSFSSNLFDYDKRPKDYSTVFSDSKIKLEQLASFQAISNYALSHARLEKYYRLDSQLRDRAFFFVSELPLMIVDRYIHLYDSFSFDEQLFFQIYQPLERGIYFEELPVEIIVPILFTKFDFDELELAANTIIKRLDEKFQLARMRRLISWGYSSVHPLVAGASTHALVLKNWTIPNERIFDHIAATSDEVVHIIDAFFGAIRILDCCETGYAQVLLNPVGWAHNYMADLPDIDIEIVKQYPPHFENGYWLKEDITTLSKEQVLEIASVFKKISENTDNSINIAIRRLNRCLLREDDEDSIIDAMIALEALLSDGTSSEISHKLALRIAALSALVDPQLPSLKIFRQVKHMYDFRSDIVHGNKNPNKKRHITLSDNTSVATVSIAIQYLRMTLKALLDYPQYRKATTIDEELLLGKLIEQEKEIKS